MSDSIPAISFIVPIYKAEAYLHYCVDSLLAQTFTNFEVLLIDDGSPDCSGEICDEYAAKDSRVRVIHKGNGGVASARQCGIENTTGEYTIHVDPDDWVEPTMAEELYRNAKDNNADIVICDFYMNYSDGRQKIWKQKPSSLNPRQILQETIQRQQGSCCNKLIRKSYYEQHSIKFEYGINLGEDLLFIVKCLSHNPKISYLGKAFYHYRRNYGKDSYTNTLRVETFNQMIQILNWMKNHLNNESFEKELYAFSIHTAFAGIRAIDMDSNTYKRFTDKYLTMTDLFKHKKSLKSLLVIGTKLGGLKAGKTIYRLFYRFVYR